MDLQIINEGLNFSKKKKLVLLLAAFSAVSYGLFRVYNLPSVVRRRKRILRLLSALVTIVEVVSESAETFRVVSHDLRAFLQSDSDEIANSLKQVSKLANSREFSDSVVCITAALTKGVFRGYQEESSGGGGSFENGLKPGFYDRFMDRLFVDSSSGFVSVVAGSFARNLVLAFYQSEASEKGGKKNVEGPSLVDVMCSDRGRDLIGECIEKYVSTAVAVYLERTISVNTYDELFAGLTNPKHDKRVRDLLVAVCNGSVKTLVKTSHQVLTSSRSGEPAKLGLESCDLSRFVVTQSNSDVVSKSFYPEINDAQNVITVKQNRGGGFLDSIADKTSSSGESWVSSVSSTLAVPSNRKLVLDLTGRVTFETMRSFLEFLLEKMFTSVKRSFGALNQAVVSAGHEVLRYVYAKSYLISSICMSLCLRVSGGTWALMPA